VEWPIVAVAAVGTIVPSAPSGSTRSTGKRSNQAPRRRTSQSRRRKSQRNSHAIPPAVLVGVEGCRAAVATARAVVPTDIGRRVRVVHDRAFIEIHGIHRPGTEDAARELAKRLTSRMGCAPSRSTLHWGGRWSRSTTRRSRSTTWCGLSVRSRTHTSCVPSGARRAGGFPASAGRWLGMRSHSASISSACPTRSRVVCFRSQGAHDLVRAPRRRRLLAPRPRLRGRRGGPSGDGRAVRAERAVVNAMAQVPLLLINDACHRCSMVTEGLARQHSWEQWDRALADREGAYDAPPLARAPRPVPLRPARPTRSPTS